MKLLVKVPDDCLLLLPQTVESFQLLSSFSLVEESGYPKQIRPTKEGISIRVVDDNVVDPESELNKAIETIAKLRSDILILTSKQMPVRAAEETF